MKIGPEEAIESPGARVTGDGEPSIVGGGVLDNHRCQDTRIENQLRDTPRCIFEGISREGRLKAEMHRGGCHSSWVGADRVGEEQKPAQCFWVIVMLSCPAAFPSTPR